MSKYSHNVVDEKNKNTPWYKIMQHINQGAVVFDVGCSSGYLGGKLIETREAEMYGLEVDEQDAADARKQGYKKVWIADLDNMDWGSIDRKFDAIVFADVLEHVKDPLRVLRGATSLLKPNGKLLASIPNVAHISVRMELMEGNFEYESTGLLDNTHIRFFTRGSVERLFNDAGLSIKDFDATINELSDGLVKERLKQMGLTPTKTFENILQSQEARVFQYIVCGTKSAKKNAKLATLPEKPRDEWLKVERKMQQDDKKIQNLQAELAEKEKQYREIKESLERIQNSKGWKLVTRVDGMRRVIKK